MVLRVINPLPLALAGTAYVFTGGRFVRASAYVFTGGSFRPAEVRLNN